MSTLRRVNQSPSYRNVVRSVLPNPAPKPELTLAADLQNLREKRPPIIEAMELARPLARQRGLWTPALYNAFSAGLLRFGNHLGKSAWFVLDRSNRNACARRMDGLSWFEGTTNAAKSVMLSGSQAKWPIGIPEARPYPNILLCEGGPDFLAAFHVIASLGKSEKYAPVTMLSGSLPIHTDALRMFKGKRVRIFAHNDATGIKAAKKWSEQIAWHVTASDIFSFAPYRVKDLNDYVRANLPLANLLP